MKLYLGSCDLGQNQEELKKWIKENGKDMILIPNALDTMFSNMQKQWSINASINKLEDVGFNVTTVSLQDYFGEYNKLRNDFDSYKAFYAIGGNVFALRKAMELSGFDNFLKDKVNQKNFLYGGYSAGICVLAKQLGMLKEADAPINPYNHDEVLEKGIGILDYLPIPHYKSGFPAGKIIDRIVDYCNQHGVKYKTLKDGESIVEDTTRDMEWDR